MILGERYFTLIRESLKYLENIFHRFNPLALVYYFLNSHNGPGILTVSDADCSELKCKKIE